MSNVKCETKYQSSGKRCVPKIPGHVLEKNTRNLYMFFSSFFKRKHVHTFVHTAGSTVAFVGPASFVFKATCPLSFQLFQQKRWSRGRLNCISMLACKGPVCVAVLTNFYGRFFVEVGQFINSKSFHLGRHFFFICWLLLTLARSIVKASRPEVNRFTGNCFRVVRIVLKITFFEIKISRPTPLDSLSVLFWLLTMVENLTSSSYSPTWTHGISRLDFIAAELKPILAHN